MKEQIVKILSQKIDKDLVNDMMSSYEKIQDSYHKGQYEETLSKSGKFVENIFRILYFIKSGTKLSEIKSGQIDEIYKKLENTDGEKLSETIRIVIPRVAKLVYTMRSKMGAEHVKPIEPDFIDAKFTVSGCDWILSELLRTYHKRDPDKVDELIQNVKSTDTLIQTLNDSEVDPFEVLLANQIDDVSIPELIILSLRINESQTKSEIIQTISKWGRVTEKWFRGGNINNRLIKTGFIIKKNSGKNDLFQLTVRGMIQAEKILEKLRSSMQT